MRIFWLAVLILAQFPISMHLFNAYSEEPSSNIKAASLLRAQTQLTTNFDEDIRPAADQFYKYIDFVKGKRLGLVVNQTSMVGDKHLVDTLLRQNCKIQRIFAPEHGFRGKADRGEHIKDGKDPQTGISIASLYGKNRKPQAELLKEIDLMIFDIQDVGVRFYTFTSTMTLIMEACAEAGIPLLILDRPNPLGHYVDGPVMQEEQKSFVGMHPVPIIHGLTVAEYAKMINGEGWLKNGVKCELYHVECSNYNHRKFYKLPIKPSPNLPNMHSIYLYPSLCLFEGTDLSVGRGTNKQFQVYGHPDFSAGIYSFTPKPMEGAKHPVQEGKRCKGYDLSGNAITSLQKENKLKINYILNFYQKAPQSLKDKFFLKTGFFHKLVGNKELMEQIKNGKSEEEIRKSWEKELNAYKKLRKKYLLYQDFE
jgi:uncharacterized protein YbbC (DUF1343 family)